MDHLAILQADLQKGFSKSDLELLIGLPKNNLTEILKGNRKLSQKSKVKIEQWEASEKPNPIKFEIGQRMVSRINITDQTKLNKMVEPIKPMGTEKTNFSVNTLPKNIPPMPVKKPGENSFDYAERKNEWKRKYNK